MATKPKAAQKARKQEAVSVNKLTLTETDFDSSVIDKLVNANLDTELEPATVPPVEPKPNGGATEITNAGVEPETQQLEGQAEAVARAESEGLKPNGQEQDKSGTEQVEPPRIKPAMLNVAADDQRKKDLEDAYTASKKSGRRMNLVAGHGFAEKYFAGRDADSVSLDEYIAYRDSALACLPPEAGDYQFTQETNNFVQSRGGDLKSAICEFFKGRYNVTLEAVRDPATWEKILMKQAEIFVASRPQGKKAIKIDAEAPVHCQSSPDCTRLFVPLSWLEYNREKGEENWTGNILVTRDGDQKWYCSTCRSIGRKHGVPFFSSRSAGKIADRILGENRREKGVLASLKDVAGYHDSHEKREDHSQEPGKFNQALADRNKNQFADLVDNKEKDHHEGRYYSPEFEWESKNGKVQTFLDLNVSRHMLTVSDAGPGLEFLKKKNFNTGFFENRALLSALYKAAEAQQN